MWPPWGFSAQTSWTHPTAVSPIINTSPKLLERGNARAVTKAEIYLTLWTSLLLRVLWRMCLGLSTLRLGRAQLKWRFLREAFPDHPIWGCHSTMPQPPSRHCHHLKMHHLSICLAPCQLFSLPCEVSKRRDSALFTAVSSAHGTVLGRGGTQ